MSDRSPHTRIKKLSPLLINQLAAGEVVTRPASVVKELLENAIDAGATHIEVRITQGGMGMIEVVDNGEGIHPDDMIMAITRHATSKVADVANLHGISTLGFRGEALAATAAVSRLSLASSHDDSGIGRQLQVAGVLADTPKMVPVVRNRGTSVTVKDLYFNVPARRGNLKSIATEFSHIETMIREVALAHADISLSLFHDNKQRLSLSHDTMRDIDIDHNRLPHPLSITRLEQALDIPLTDNAIKLTVDLSNLIQSSDDEAHGQINQQSAYISGWLWPIYDEQMTQTALTKLLYINGRLVKEPIISNQLRQLAHSAQLDGMGYALYFKLPSHWLNVNVHPSKQRIKISSLTNIMAHLSQAIGHKIKAVQTKKSAVVINSNSADLQTLNDKSFTDYSIDNDSANNIANNTSNSATSSELTGATKSYKSKIAGGSLSAQSVKEHSQLYQHSIATESASHLDHAQALDFNVSHKSTTATQIADVDMRAIDLTSVTVINNITLPKCLEIIDSLDYKGKLKNQNSISDNYSIDTMPWLLFYKQDKLVLISERVWKISISSLFETSLPSFAKSSTAVDKVNHELAFYASQMSQQDLIAFLADIERILMTNAIKVIDREQLLDFILSDPAI